VRPGLEGELVVGGAAVGRGYLNLPELTAERFPEHDLGRWCRTGDRVRLRAGGEIEYLGRLDDQLSIRGFRVEPGEVAGALNKHPAIGASVAVAAGSSSADKQLVAYVVAAGSERPGPEQLTEFLAASVPDYMRPSRYVWLDQLPLTAHGKVDRDALPNPAAVNGKPDASDARDAPRAPIAGTDTETAVASVVAELLELDTVGMDENFFLLGGHSMLGAQLTVRLGDLFGADISLRYLFDHPTPAEIAAEVQRQMDSDQAADRAAE
jgi:acyl-CoA synthetase (AMP-forming)/AMP-acid ligase II